MFTFHAYVSNWPFFGSGFTEVFQMLRSGRSPVAQIAKACFKACLRVKKWATGDPQLLIFRGLEVTWPADMICIGWCGNLVQSLDGQACDWLPQSRDQVSNKFLSWKKSKKRREGTIYKLRGQEDMHTWSEKYPFLSTFRVEILSTHMVKNWQYFVQIVCECPLTY